MREGEAGREGEADHEMPSLFDHKEPLFARYAIRIVLGSMQIVCAGCWPWVLAGDALPGRVQALGICEKTKRFAGI